jgi:hypothetical protein
MAMLLIDCEDGLCGLNWPARSSATGGRGLSGKRLAGTARHSRAFCRIDWEAFACWRFQLK